MTAFDQQCQHVERQYNAGHITIYEGIVPQDVETATLAEAEQQLSTLPLDTIPAIAPLPAGSRMPFSPNSLFVGREADLRALAAALKAGATAAIGQIAAATGLGGIGKTQLATEFVHRYGHYFAGGVFWLSFASADGVPAEVALCGRPGHLDLRPDFDALSLDDQVRLVRGVWHSALPRLLVFDNCEDEALLAQWRPTTGGCRVLVTSRRAQWEAALGVQALALGVLSRAESVALLRQQRPDLRDAAADLEAIAAEVGDLPLALHLAGSFLKRYQYDITPAAYLAELRGPAILQHPSFQAASVSPTGHEHHVARTFTLSYERLDMSVQEDRLARALLARAAHFAPGEPIPRELLKATFHAAHTPLEFGTALTRLSDLGLLEQEAEGALRLHRLLAVFVRNVTLETEAQAKVEQTLLKLSHWVNQDRHPAPLLAVQPHLRAVTDAAQNRMDVQGARLCTELGLHLHMIGTYEQAQPYLERALAIHEQVLGPAHPDTAASLNNLASLLTEQGDLSAARPFLERALMIYEQVLGPTHPFTATSLNNLAVLLKAQGAFAAARPLYERALAIREQVLGPTHPLTATSLNNLASMLHDQGDYDAARPLYERALTIREQELGPTHPDTAVGLNNLARLLQDQDDLATARSLLERALAIQEQVLGPVHPSTATSLNNLASLLQAQGDLTAARPLFERALDIQEQVLGPVHPYTAAGLCSLASLLHAQGDLTAARPLFERALDIQEQVLSPMHPDTATNLINLANLLKDQGDPVTARLHYERALAIYEQVLGPTHPKTATSLNNLASLLQDQGELMAARPLFKRALAIGETQLGHDHPTTAKIRANLATLDSLM